MYPKLGVLQDESMVKQIQESQRYAKYPVLKKKYSIGVLFKPQLATTGSQGLAKAKQTNKQKEDQKAIDYTN